MASALRLRVRASVAIKAAVSLRPARVSAAFRAGGGYRGRSDSNRGRMPQGGGRSSSSGRGRGGSRTPQNNGLDPRIVYAGIGAVVLLLIVTHRGASAWLRIFGAREHARDAHCYQDDDQEVF